MHIFPLLLLHILKLRIFNVLLFSLTRHQQDMLWTDFYKLFDDIWKSDKPKKRINKTFTDFKLRLVQAKPRQPKMKVEQVIILNMNNISHSPNIFVTNIKVMYLIRMHVPITGIWLKRQTFHYIQFYSQYTFIFCKDIHELRLFSGGDNLGRLHLCLIFTVVCSSNNRNMHLNYFKYMMATL